MLLYLTRIRKYWWKFSAGFIFRIWNVMLLFRQFKLILINHIQKTILLHSMDDLHTHTHTHRIYIFNKINGAESFLRSWRSLSQSRDFSPIMRPKVRYGAHHIWEPVSHLVTLRFFRWQTVKPYGEPILYSSRRQFIFKGIHGRYSIHFLNTIRLGLSVCITAVPQVRNVSMPYSGSTG